MAGARDEPERMEVELANMQDLTPPVLEPYVASVVKGPKIVWYDQDAFVVGSNFFKRGPYLVGELGGGNRSLVDFVVVFLLAGKFLVFYIHRWFF